MQFKQTSPLGTTQRGVFTAGGNSRIEFDPVGAIVRTNPHSLPDHSGGSGDIPSGGSGPLDGRFSSMSNPLSGCSLDGVLMPCSVARRGEGESSYVQDVDPFVSVMYRGRRKKPVWVEVDTSTAVVTGPNELTIYAGSGGHFEWVDDPDEILEVYVNSQNTVTAPIGDLKGNLQKILDQRTKSGTCEEYTTKLLAQAANMFAGNYPHIKTIMEGYKRITGPTGGKYILMQYPYDTVKGDLFANGADPGTVWLVPNRQYGSSMSAQMIAELQADYAWTALHETFHLGRQGGYSDEQMAAAAYALAGLTLPTTSLTGDARTFFYSDKFDAQLMKHCPKLQVRRR